MRARTTVFFLCLLAPIGCSLITDMGGLAGSAAALDAATGNGDGDAAGGGSDSGDAQAVDAQSVPIVAGDTTTGAALSDTHVDVPAPQGAKVGDLLLANVFFGNQGSSAQPAITPSTPWTLVVRTDHDTRGSLAVYYRVVDGTEPAVFTWPLPSGYSSVAWITAYRNVDTARPIDAFAGLDVASSMTSYPAPSVTTTRAGAVLVFGYGSWAFSNVTWSPPPSTATRAIVTNHDARSGVGADIITAVAGPTPIFNATVSPAPQYVVTSTVALSPHP